MLSLLYAAHNLAAHLRLGGDYKKLFTLVDTSAWYDSQMALDPSGVNYVNDVFEAWIAAEALDGAAINNGELATFLGREIRCALQSARMHSQAQHIPPALAIELVSSGLWKPEQALALFQQTPDQEQKIEIINSLASQLSADFLMEAVNVVRTIKDDFFKSLGFQALIPYLPANIKLQLLDDIHELADAEDQVWALIAIGSGLPDYEKLPILEEILQVVYRIKEAHRQVKVLIELLPLLPMSRKLGVLDEVLAVMHTIEPDWKKLEPLGCIIPHLSQVDQQPLLQEALKILQTELDSREYGHIWADSLSILIPYLPEGEQEALLNQALNVARRLIEPPSVGSARAEALVAVARWLPADEQSPVLWEALTAARNVPDSDRFGNSNRAEALVRILPHLPNNMKSDVLDEILTIARTIEVNWFRAEILAMLAAYLPHTTRRAVLQEALLCTRDISSNRWQAEVLAMLFPYLPENRKAEMWYKVIDMARTLEDGPDRVEILVNLSSFAREEEKSAVLLEALDSIRKFESSSFRPESLALLAMHSDEKTQKAAVRLAQRILYPPDRAHALALLAPYMHGKIRLRMLWQALKDIKTEVLPGKQIQVLRLLAPQLSQGLLRRAYRIISTIKVPSLFLEALVALIPRLSEPSKSLAIREALEIARATQWDGQRAQHLAILVPLVPQEDRLPLIQEALTTARSSKYHYSGQQALAKLAPYIPSSWVDSTLREAFVASCSSGDEICLEALMPYLSHEERLTALQRALVYARSLEDDNVYARPHSLKVLVPWLCDLSLARLYSLWHETLHILADRTHVALRFDTGSLAGIIATLGGEEAVTEMASAILDIG